MAVYEFKLPELGEGLHEGRISKWLVKPGDSVKEDDAIAEVENDKSLVELPSPVDGTVKSLAVEEGTTSVVGDLLITFEVEGEGNVAADSPKAEAQAPKAETKAETPKSKDEAPKSKDKSLDAKADTAKESAAATGDGAATKAEAEPAQSAAASAPQSATDTQTSHAHEVLATPGVRKFAREQSVDITRVTGTGANGKITRADVEQFQSAGTATASAATGQDTTADAESTTATAAAPRTGQAETEDERVPLSGIRKIIAQSMAKSMYTAPHVTVMDEADVSKLVALRQELKPLAAERGSKITYLPFIVKAMIAGLRKYPHLNASLDDERQELIVKKSYHIGIATDTERGLMVPVIRNADRKSMWSIADEITDLATRARSNKLGPAEMKGSTISITNIGSAGGMFFTPIINFPEVAILGLGRITERPIMQDGQVVGAQMMALSLSIDHRVIDGAMAQNFVNEVKRLLENPRLLLMEV